MDEQRKQIARQKDNKRKKLGNLQKRFQTLDPEDITYEMREEIRLKFGL